MSADFAPDPLPKATREDGLGDQGMRMVDRVVSEDLGWIFRDQTRKDFGIDALIELAHRDRRVTGRLIAAQIKCGKSWFSEPMADGTGWVYRGEVKHLNYWLGHSLPVILILCDQDDDRCYYAHVAAARVRQTSSGWSIVVPRAQILDASAQEHLKRLTRAPQRKDVIEFALLQHLVDRWGDRLRICPILEAPRDFQRFAHLIEIRGETGGTFGVHFIDASVRLPTAEAIEEELEWRDYNERATGGGVKDLMLFVVGDDPESIRLSADAEELVDRSPNLRLHRLLYDDERIVSLTEIDSGDRPLEFWPGADEPGL
ncbi:DUF4365 domain-containing protein [Thermoleophilia bacterium SCSIO 60948]|nr:DUF4365 domain-containing protein [Thermoleophilia bacterium SCSIO 60948]